MGSSDLDELAIAATYRDVCSENDRNGWCDICFNIKGNWKTYKIKWRRAKFV